MSTQIISDAIELLKDKNAPKWQTAENISKKLNNRLTSEELENLLIKRYKSSNNSVIRYSSLPSKKSLSVLWGHIDKVGNRKLFDIFREDEEITPEYLKQIEDERNIFLSHSFKDFDKVILLANKLVKFDFNPWLAESEIKQNYHINNEVKEAIERLPYFGIYLTDNVLNSTWSAKEFEYALINKRKLFAFIDEDSKQIISLINDEDTNYEISIHQLLRKLFDKSHITDNIEFVILTNKLKINNTIFKPLKNIEYFS